MKKFIVLTLIPVLFLSLAGISFAGTYALFRSSVMYSDGTVIDSLESWLTVSGTMWIEGNRAIQEITVCAPSCVTASASGTLLEFGENYHSVSVRNDDNSVSEIVLLSLDPVMTFFNAGMVSEVDQWVLTGSADQHNVPAPDSKTAGNLSRGILGAVFEQAVSDLRP